ncbi:zinc carboxypeptidase-like [Aricia agestis]|uniref:zinc carboxypeptidase-like n=1 Tax=Aricia agestis TaxID=91739 RepID=UPI001C209B19|nr:zinc carboxypeptidase-like [Aricia agestis]
MRLTAAVILLTLTPVFNCAEYKDYKDYRLYNVQGNNENLKTLDDVLQDYEDSILLLDGTADSAQVLVAPSSSAVFNDLAVERNLKITLVTDDVSELLLSEKGNERARGKYSFKAYHDVSEMQNFIKNISKAYPEITEVIVAGKSYEGRPVMGIRINTPTESNKPVFFIESGIHAREWIGPATTTYFVHQLLTSANPNITRLRDQFDWRIFPTVNPDGYQYSYRYERYWRKTRSRSANGCFGADPNRNWDHNWGQYSSSNRPCDYQTYAGSKPFSEAETRALRDYLSTIDNLLFYVAFHSYASLLLIPYSDSTDHVHNYDDLVRVGKVSLEYGKRVANSSYGGPAPAAEVLYKASGGSMDWVYQALGAPLVYTYELRGDSFHWPASRIPEQGEEVTQMILGLADGANALGYF